jgi:hypothetical protein
VLQFEDCEVGVSEFSMKNILSYQTGAHVTDNQILHIYSIELLFYNVTHYFISKNIIFNVQNKVQYEVAVSLQTAGVNPFHHIA